MVRDTLGTRFGERMSLHSPSPVALPSPFPGNGSRPAETRPSGLRVDDHVRDIRALAADSFFDLARPRVRVVQTAPAVEAERQERDQAVVRPQKPQLAR